MSKNNRVAFLFKLLLLAYLGFLVILTLLPDASNITYETTVNLIPLTTIDNFFYDIVVNGFIDWEFLATKPTNPTEILLYTFTDSFKNLAGNIILFLPLGFLYPLARKNKVGFFHVFVVILGTTCAIELIQYLFLASRRADVDDIILNLIGGLIGYLVYKWIE
ncbi:VanZ family protein [Acetobacterium wieringae]|uniref:VanZ family protein n=1 Tax=Acetobacterium wieringae TaxID=52694 RepID=A0A5D0WH93_9FIRM|nr:VanZ family protein [Acetobacterium wieringae]TYC82290.1 VanZ family protein [Acetobacterium wieringae]